MKIGDTHNNVVRCSALIPVLVILGAQLPPSDVIPDASFDTYQQRMAEGTTSSEQLTATALDEIERQRHLNAFISVDAVSALAQARRLDEQRSQGQVLGPLHGIPIAVKDNIHVAGMPNTAGTPLLASFVPDEDAPVVARLKAAGAIMVGKANMHELAFGITSMNAAFGAVGNACDPDFIPGGSSGGTAVAVAAGMAVAGLGTDTGGSSRIPAALNGIVGFRPTVGRYPAGGLTPISSTRDTVGPMARSVADVAVLDAVMADESTELPEVDLRGLRLGVPRDYFYDDLEPLIVERIEALFSVLLGAGVILVEEDLVDIAALNQTARLQIVPYEAPILLREYLAELVPGQTLEALADSIASPDVRTMVAGVVGGATTESAYRQSIDFDRPRLQEAYANYFAEHRVEAILFPTTPLTARRIAEVGDTVELNGEQVPTFGTYVRNTDPGSNAGIPGLSIPLPAAVDEMPTGVEIDGPEGSDRRLLAIGAAIESLVRQREGSL
ncbi:MAG: indoleacetamide hydrolase [Rhodospirillaceae bacterium]|nr:indoleacetamide hydrolase [Rhodospirillaceae bacterium]